MRIVSRNQIWVVAIILTVVAYVSFLIGSSGQSTVTAAQRTVTNTTPNAINFQCVVQIDDQPFSGDGHFKFAIIDAVQGDGTQNYWANDGTASGETSTALTLAVSDGYFTIMLGDTAIAGMTQPLDETVFAQSESYLRVWFSADGSEGSFEALEPNQRIGSVAYALRAKYAESGPIGPKGDKGDPGEQGPIGPKGEPGDSGTTEWSGLDGIPADLADGDNDTLDGLGCTTNQIARFGESGWECADPPIDYALQMAALDARLGALETLLDNFSLITETNTVLLNGVNLQVVNGTGTTDGETNGLGNIIVGYNELRIDDDNEFTDDDNNRSGSHSLIVGSKNNYTSTGSVVFGYRNTVSADFATVTGGNLNTAGGLYSTISGGIDNVATGESSAIGGGESNDASGQGSSVTCGLSNQATGIVSTVNGGRSNLASGPFSVVSGGFENAASEQNSAVSGGHSNNASGYTSSISGGSLNIASGDYASVSGGGLHPDDVDDDFDITQGNIARGRVSSVSGGTRNVAGADYSSVTGGVINTANGVASSVSGGELNNASGTGATVTGGYNNAAGGLTSSVSGGSLWQVEDTDGWAAGENPEDLNQLSHQRSRNHAE